MTLTQMLQLFMASTGEYLSESYYRLLDMEVSEALYHCFLWQDLKKKQHNIDDRPEWAREVEWQPTQLQ
ncbi:hypothetical protein [Nostoc sp. CENA543]|uniref:hypothetical protein n=1 Tax=Nostoc sp. CENA543 TaxID=1869241 RepID=UPI0013000410|nr:hypothetical protein [Nostoc sp. CENA543]